MADNFHSAYFVADQPELFEPQRTNNFAFVVTDLNGILRANSSLYSDGNKNLPSAESTLYYSVRGSSVPHKTVNVLQNKRGNGVAKFAGTASWDSGTLVIDDWIGTDAKSVLYAWEEIANNSENETVGRAKDYKKNCTLLEYTPDYKQVVRRWNLKGCWISDVKEDDKSFDQDGQSKVQAKLEYDRAYMVVPEEETSVANSAA